MFDFRKELFRKERSLMIVLITNGGFAMIKGLTSHKVRQSAPKPPVKKCSPSRTRESGQRGRKATPKEQVPLVTESISGLDKKRFPHIANEVWNALSSAFRSSAQNLLQSIEAFSRDPRNDVLELIQKSIPNWAFQAGIGAIEAALVNQTGYLGSRLICDECGQLALRFKGYAAHSFKISLGTVSHKRAYYHCDCCQHSAYPMDHELGLDGEHRMVPQLQETMALMSARVSYPEALDIISKLLPVRHCLKLQENVTRTIASDARTQQEREHREAFLEPAKARFPKAKLPGEEASEVAAVAADGGYCPMKGKGEPAREFKLGVLGWLHLKPRTRPDEEPPEVKGRHYTGTFKGCDFAMELTEIEFRRMGLDKAKTIQVIGDGAEWIWNRANNFRANDDQELVFTLDLYHARERVSKVAEAFFGNQSLAGHEWYKARDVELLEGRLPAFFGAFTHLAKAAKVRGDNELAAAILENRTYFHKRQPMLDYKKFLERGLLVGSGMVEGGIRFVGKDRLDRTGMKWSEPGAENILLLRTLHASGRWEDFVDTRTQHRREKAKALKSRWLGLAA